LKAEEVKPLTEFLVRELVEHPELVRVSSTESADGLSIEVAVGPDDVGKVIGRDGRTIQSIRNIVSALGRKIGTRVRVELLGEKKPPGETPHSIASASTDAPVALQDS
jgi:uncharacterized protein